jgi:hypothetical protein
MVVVVVGVDHEHGQGGNLAHLGEDRADPHPGVEQQRLLLAEHEETVDMPRFGEDVHTVAERSGREPAGGIN